MDVRLISFTGSGQTGRLIQEAAAISNMKNVILELGGKSPAVVFADADIKRAARETAYSIQWNSGQVCMANSRIYVEETVVERFISLFKQSLQSVKLGDPLDSEVNHGPQADQKQFDVVKSYIELGKKEGKIILGEEMPSNLTGYFVQPTIFLDTPESSRIMKEEVFGPVVNINVFTSEDEVIRKANSTEYGLYAAVYTKDIDRAMRFAKSLEAGTVAINCTSPTGAFDLPFGGFKASGLGREGIHDSLDNYLETKAVLINIG
jgi:aldehyde dehydrogenase (NAD+)